MPGSSLLHYLLEFAQIYVHWVGDAIQPSHPLPSPSPPAFSLSQHQGLLRWVNYLHLVAKELKLQHYSSGRLVLGWGRGLEVMGKEHDVSLWGDGNALKFSWWLHNSVTIPNTTELHTLNGWIICFVNCISIRLWPKAIRFYSHDEISHNKWNVRLWRSYWPPGPQEPVCWFVLAPVFSSVSSCFYTYLLII